MKRRNLIFGLLAVATTAGARAEQSRKAYRIAVVDAVHPAAEFTRDKSDEPFLKAFFGELHRLGYVEGDNLLFEVYSGEGRAAHYPDLALDVVRRNPDLIIAFTNDLVLDFKATTTTIPIVGTFSSPVEAGIVASLARPGGNITGVTVDSGDEQWGIWGKRLQLLRQVVPNLTRLAVLETRRSRDGWEALMPEFSRRWAVTYVGPPLNHPLNEAEYRRVFAAIAQDGAEGIVVNDEEEHQGPNLKLVVELAEKTRLPAIYTFKTFVQAGGLMSYGVDVPDLGRRVADMVGEILKGARPSEIPIRRPTKFDLTINLKTAKALGLNVPPELLATADEVIE